MSEYLDLTITQADAGCVDAVKTIGNASISDFKSLSKELVYILKQRSHYRQFWATFALMMHYYSLHLHGNEDCDYEDYFVRYADQLVSFENENTHPFPEYRYVPYTYLARFHNEYYSSLEKDGEFSAVDNFLIMECHKKAAELGSGQSANSLGVIYDKRQIRTQQNSEISYQYFLKSRELGYKMASANLCVMHKYGRGCEKNYNLACIYGREFLDNINSKISNNMYAKTANRVVEMLLSGGYKLEKDVRAAAKIMSEHHLKLEGIWNHNFTLSLGELCTMIKSVK